MLLVQLPPSLLRDDARLASFLGLVPDWMRVAVDSGTELAFRGDLRAAGSAPGRVLRDERAKPAVALQATTDFIYLQMRSPVVVACIQFLPRRRPDVVG